MSDKARSILAEGALIVISILVAFAIDAWWEEQQDRKEEVRILGALAEEFRANAEEIPFFMNVHARAGFAAEQIIDELRQAGPGESVPVSAARVAMVLSHHSTDPYSSTLDALLQAGELRYIRNAELRKRLARWPRMVVDATENELILREIWEPQLLSVISGLTDISPVMSVADRCYEDDATPGCNEHMIPVPHDLKLLGMLMPVRGYAAEAARELGLLIAEASEIVAMIDTELTIQQTIQP